MSEVFSVMGESRNRRRDRRKWYVVLLVFVVAFTFGFLRSREKDGADAASLDKFDPGYIISDYQMSNYKSMTEKEIQKFLTDKNPCNNRDKDYYNELTQTYPNITWHFENGHFICLSEEKFGDGEVIGKGETAAHIIWQAAQDYEINPQVLIVLLQKEQGLITDTFPNSRQYRAATGYGCPDTAACSTKYYGFKNQVRNAAAMFRTVLNGGWTNYPLGKNYIQYNPNAACGGSIVNVKNLATSALYRYTPYQPNAAALAAGYGLASCGAYGNRNFYLYFEDWFGGITDEGRSETQRVISSIDNFEVEDSDLEMSYKVFLQHYGWLSEVKGGYATGSVGNGIQLEAVTINTNASGLGIEYRTHVQSLGWGDYKRNGEVSGTTDKSLRVEAIQMRLTGEFANSYDIYYRVHVQSLGWMDWVKNDEVAGTTGQRLRVEAIQIKIVRKKSNNVASYSAYVQSLGWMDWVKNGEMAGTTGQARRMEAIEIKLSDDLTKKYDIYYRVHVQSLGWMDWVKNGEMAGTTGQARRMEAIEIKFVDKV